MKSMQWSRLFAIFKDPNSFTRIASLLLSANVISQSAGILLVLVISRYYTPEMYGEFAIFSTLTLVIASVSMLAYEQAIIIPKGKSTYRHLVVLATTLLLIATLALLLILGTYLLINASTEQPIDVPAWVYLIPSAVILFSARTIFGQINLRLKNYNLRAVNALLNGLSSRAFAIVYAIFAGPKSIGLALGFCFNSFLALSILWIFSVRQGLHSIFNQPKRSHLYETAREFSAYPKSILPANLLNTLSDHLLIFGFALLFSTKLLGAYNFGLQLLMIPIAMLSNSMQYVFLQKINEKFQDTQSSTEFLSYCRKLLLPLVYLASLMVTVVALFGPEIFAFVLSEKWRLSGEILSSLAPGLTFLLAWQVFSPVIQVLHIEHVAFSASITNLAGSIIALVLGYISSDFYTAIYFLAAYRFCFYGAAISYVLLKMGQRLAVTFLQLWVLPIVLILPVVILN